MPFLLAIVTFYTRYASIIRYVAIISSILTGVLYVRHSGVVAEQNKQNKIAIAGVKTNEKTNNNVMSLSDGELDKRLHKWFRD